MRAKLKEQIVNWLIIVIFLAFILGAGYVVIKIMTRWSVKGLG